MKAGKGKVVSIHYTLTDDSGKQIDSSRGTVPLEYVHGAGYILPKLEEHIEGKEPGESFSACISAKDGYGEYDDGLVVRVPRQDFETDLPLEPGMRFQAQTNAGPAVVTITRIEDDIVTVDANHELAGKNLHFDVEIVSVREATEQELSSGMTGGCSGCGGGSCGGNCGDGDCSCGGGCANCG